MHLWKELPLGQSLNLPKSLTKMHLSSSFIPSAKQRCLKLQSSSSHSIFLNANDEYAQQLAPRIKVDKLMYKTFDNDNIEADIYFESHSFKK